MSIKINYDDSLDEGRITMDTSSQINNVSQLRTQLTRFRNAPDSVARVAKDSYNEKLVPVVSKAIRELAPYQQKTNATAFELGSKIQMRRAHSASQKLHVILHDLKSSDIKVVERAVKRLNSLSGSSGSVVSHDTRQEIREGIKGARHSIKERMASTQADIHKVAAYLHKNPGAHGELGLQADRFKQLATQLKSATTLPTALAGQIAKTAKEAHIAIGEATRLESINVLHTEFSRTIDGILDRSKLPRFPEDTQKIEDAKGKLLRQYNAGEIGMKEYKQRMGQLVRETKFFVKVINPVKQGYTATMTKVDAFRLDTEFKIKLKAFYREEARLKLTQYTQTPDRGSRVFIPEHGRFPEPEELATQLRKDPKATLQMLSERTKEMAVSRKALAEEARAEMAEKRRSAERSVRYIPLETWIADVADSDDGYTV